MKGYTIEQLRNLLRQNVLEITFVKKDGTKRVMLASTNGLYLPERDQDEESTRTRTPNPEILTAFDLDKNAWRSMRFDSIETFIVTDRPVLKSYEEGVVA